MFRVNDHLMRILRRSCESQNVCLWRQHKAHELNYEDSIRVRYKLMFDSWCVLKLNAIRIWKLFKYRTAHGRALWWYHRSRWKNERLSWCTKKNVMKVSDHLIQLIKKKDKTVPQFFLYNYIFRDITFLYYFSLYNLMRLFLFVFPLSIRVM